MFPTLGNDERSYSRIVESRAFNSLFFSAAVSLPSATIQPTHASSNINGSHGCARHERRSSSCSVLPGWKSASIGRGMWCDLGGHVPHQQRRQRAAVFQGNSHFE